MSTNPLPKRLREARQAAELSQRLLGIAAGMDEFSGSARMNQYETGKHTPDFSILERIAKVLRVPVAYFYAQDDILAELLFLYGQLKASDRKDLLRLIKSFV